MPDQSKACDGGDADHMRVCKGVFTGGRTSVLPSGAPGFLTSSTAVSRFSAGLNDTAEVDWASGAASAART